MACSEDLSAVEHQSPPARRQPLEGGFEVEFVEPPKELQTECPICLQVLCEPYQATCCGYSYCKNCIKRMKNNKQRCPTCNEEEYDIFADKRLQRSLSSFHVRCSNQPQGCKWVGELGELERHLNPKPTSNARLSGCPYVKVKCELCGDFFNRLLLEDHTASLCPMRPYTCEYCQSYKSNCHDVTVNHWPVCPGRPIPCPNDCGVYPERHKLQQHITSECAKATHKCPFAHTGCNKEFTAREMEEHLRDNMIQHVSSMAAHEQHLSKQVSDLNMILQASASTIAALNEEKQGMKDQLNQQSESIQLLQSELERLKIREENDRRMIEALQAHSSVVPITFMLDDFEGRLKHKDMGWNPPPFYTHPQGYKMLLCVDVYGNGTGKGTHMSVFLSLLKGEFDEHLKWPFRASVTIRLQNQEDDEGHYEEVIKYHDSTPAVTAGRIFEDGRQGRPWGKGKFIAHSELAPKYLKNDCLRIGISSVELQ